MLAYIYFKGVVRNEPSSSNILTGMYQFLWAVGLKFLSKEEGKCETNWKHFLQMQSMPTDPSGDPMTLPRPGSVLTTLSYPAKLSSAHVDL